MSRATRSADGFTAEDRKLLQGMATYIKKIHCKVSSLQNTVKNHQAVILQQNKEINTLRSLVNLQNYRIDAENQYNRRETAKVLNVNKDLGEDAVKIMVDICKEIDQKAPPYKGTKVSIDLQQKDIHRCHFMGEGEKRKIICKFTPAAYKKKMLLMLNKKHVNQARTGKFKSIFVAEDLTPSRSRLVWFIKTHFSEKFHKVHTRNGVIKMKHKSDDTNNGTWISVQNPDDLHGLVGDDFDLDLFNKELYPYKILPDLPAPIFEEIIDDDEFEDELGLFA